MFILSLTGIHAIRAFLRTTQPNQKKTKSENKQFNKYFFMSGLKLYCYTYIYVQSITF